MSNCLLQWACAVIFVDNPPVLHEEQTSRLQLEEKAA